MQCEILMFNYTYLNCIKCFILYYVNIYLEENIKYLVIIYYELNLLIVIKSLCSQLNCN